MTARWQCGCSTEPDVPMRKRTRGRKRLGEDVGGRLAEDLHRGDVGAITNGDIGPSICPCIKYYQSGGYFNRRQMGGQVEVLCGRQVQLPAGCLDLTGDEYHIPKITETR